MTYCLLFFHRPYTHVLVVAQPYDSIADIGRERHQVSALQTWTSPISTSRVRQQLTKLFVYCPFSLS